MDQQRQERLAQIATALVRQRRLKDQDRHLPDGSPIVWDVEVGESADGVGMAQLLTNDEQRVIAESRARYSEPAADPFYRPSPGDGRKPIPGPERTAFVREIYLPDGTSV